LTLAAAEAGWDLAAAGDRSWVGPGNKVIYFAMCSMYERDEGLVVTK